MKTNTVAACDARADQMGLNSNTCESAVDANYPPNDLDEGCNAHFDAHSNAPNPYSPCGPIPDDTESEETASPLTPLDELNVHISCSTGTCELSEEITQWIIDYPETFMLKNGGSMEPYAPSGSIDGYQFTAVPSESLADKLGFEVDDVITKINNHDVGDSGNWSTIAASLSSASTALVHYERNSTEYTLTITVDD